MLLKFLSNSDKLHLVELAKLLALADKPLLWDGKTTDEFTSDTDLSELSIQEGEQERELIAELEQSVDSRSIYNPFSSHGDVADRLIEVLKTFPIPKAEKPATRVQAATTVLKELLKDKKFELLSTPKVILFELLLVALRDGNISSIEWALLKEFQVHHQLEDFIFDDLLERAETLSQEVSKTISIILE
ncbi:hypothetical protein QN412_21125 [Pseudomonas sp. RTB3]|uniref:hypothetical protein n=1 Tax=unclassified Pseudomonas TaxID=196821 RepID=UPI002B236EFA|nr:MULTISPECIES: hypothetical protein [unclassified Pseudomonas]MEB0007248.1 hypothetical protein [Pseudomonas sp. RTB2]MEB0019431.1 hypothetical protein [Pseudomonas sp. RTB3]MEB0270412.1 hypothetical protein [Pseudomonas sp. 5B4]